MTYFMKDQVTAKERRMNFNVSWLQRRRRVLRNSITIFIMLLNL